MKKNRKGFEKELVLAIPQGNLKDKGRKNCQNEEKRKRKKTMTNKTKKKRKRKRRSKKQRKKNENEKGNEK